MALIVSAQSGNWADGTTWVGGVVPALTDDKTIAAGHVVTVAATVATEGTLRVEGEISIASEQTLEIGTFATKKAGTLLMAGGTISGAGTLGANWALFTSTGDTWSTIACNTIKKIPTTSSSYYWSWDLHKTVIRNVNQLYLIEGGLDDSTTGATSKFDISDCVIKDNTYVYLLQYVSGRSKTVNHVVKRVSFVENYRITVGGADILTVLYDTCLFMDGDKGDFRLGGSSMASQGVTMRNCVAINMNIWSLPNIYTFEKSFFTADHAEAYTAGQGGEDERCALTDSLVYSLSQNDRAVTHPKCYRNFAYSAHGGSNTFLVNSNNFADWQNNVCIGNGEGFTALPVDGEVLLHTVTNNTCVGHNLMDYEHKTPASSSQINIKNNLLVPYSTEYNLGFFIVQNGVVGPVPVTMDYNHRTSLNPSWLPSEVVNSVAGDNNVIHDAIDYPQFVDGTRDFERYAKEVLGLSFTDYHDLWDYMAQLNGYDSATGTHSKTPLAETVVTDMHTWLMAGYVPTNTALATAGEGGTFIGAFEPKSVVVVTADISLKANANTVTIGDNVTYTLTLSEALPDDLTVTVTIGNVDRTTRISANALEGYIAFTTATVGNLVAQIKNTDNGNVTITGSVVNVVVNDVAPPPPQGKFFRPLEVATVDESHVNLTVPNGVTGELQITLTYTKG